MAARNRPVGPTVNATNGNNLEQPSMAVGRLSVLKVDANGATTATEIVEMKGSPQNATLTTIQKPIQPPSIAVNESRYVLTWGKGAKINPPSPCVLVRFLSDHNRNSSKNFVLLASIKSMKFTIKTHKYSNFAYSSANNDFGCNQVVFKVG